MQLHFTIGVLENYKGYAETASKTGLGALKQLKNAWGDLLEQVGQAMIPFVNKLTALLSKVVSALQRISPEGMKIIVVVGGIVASLGPLSLALSGILKMMPMMASGLTALLSPVGLAVTAILALGAAFLYAKQQKQALIDEMTSDFEKLSLRTLEARLKENRRLQAVNGNESPWQGQSVASKVTYALNKGKRRDELKSEEQALLTAIERNKKKLEDYDKAQAQSAEISRQMEEALAGVNTELKSEGGIINSLNERIAEFERKKLLPSSSLEDIARYNEEINNLREELSNIQSLTPDRLTRKALEPLEKLPEIKAPALKVDDSALAPLSDKYAERMRELYDAVREGLYGWADESSDYLKQNTADLVQIVQRHTETLVGKGYKFETALEEVYNRIGTLMQNFDREAGRFLTDSIVASAEAIGKILTGDLGFGGLMKAILTQFASFLKNIGTQLIEFGTMILMFKTTLKSVLANPWGAIAVGASMVAASAIMTSLINKNAESSIPALARGGLAYGKTYAMVGDNPNARVDPEVIAPLSKLRTMLPTAGTQNIRIDLGGQLTARGRDLVYVLGKENYKLDVLGG